MSKLKSIVKSFRLISLTATATPWLASLLISLELEKTITWNYSLLSLIGILFLQLGVNTFNDVSDFKKKIDIKGEFGGSGVLVSGELTSKFMTIMASCFFFLAIVIAIYLYVNIPAMKYIIILGLISSLFYSLPFFGLKYVALGDLAVFIGCGPVLMMGYGMSNGSYYIEHILVGCFFGLYAIGILHTNNMEDIVIDKKRNVATLANLMGFKKSLYFLIIIYALGSLALLIGYLFYDLTIMAFLLHLLSLPIMIQIIKKFAVASSSEDKEIKLLRIKASQLHLLSGILVCLGIGINLWF